MTSDQISRTYMRSFSDLLSWASHKVDLTNLGKLNPTTSRTSALACYLPGTHVHTASERRGEQSFTQYVKDCVKTMEDIHCLPAGTMDVLVNLCKQSTETSFYITLNTRRLHTQPAMGKEKVSVVEMHLKSVWSQTTKSIKYVFIIAACSNVS